MATEKKSLEDAPTTASFRITVGQKDWIESEAIRRKESQSKIVQGALEKARAEADEPLESRAA